MNRTVAAIDCGTNSIRLLIVRAPGANELVREVRLARLGQGVDATGEFHPEALARTFAIVDEFAAIIASHNVNAVRFVATSAARDVTNRDVLFDGVRERLGVEVDVISGAEEARLSAAGVASGVQATEPMLVIDIGGGSTELVTRDGDIRHVVSLDMGAVRIKERFLLDDPPSVSQQETARGFVRDLLEHSGTPFNEIACAVGVAGTVTTLAAAELGLREYSRQAVHNTRLTHHQIKRHSRRWLSHTAEQIQTEPGMHPLRASVIGAGSLILDEIVGYLPGDELIVSETDILDGIAYALLGQA